MPVAKGRKIKSKSWGLTVKLTGQPRLVDGRIVFALYEIQELGGGG